MSSPEYQKQLKKTQKKYGICENQLISYAGGAPIEGRDSSGTQYYSTTYNNTCLCQLSYDYFYGIVDLAFNPKTNKLFVYEDKGSASRGTHKIVYTKEVKYKRKWMRRWRRCLKENK